MALITKDVLAGQLEKGLIKKDGVLTVKKEDILTPSAREFLKDNNISVSDKPTGFQTAYGLFTEEKPEHMTHLYANFLVPKNHPRIQLRGKLDSLESQILLTQITANELNLPRLADDLQEIITFTRNIIQCEVKNKPLPEFFLQGLDAAALRDHSHHPSKYYGMRHFLPTCTHGRVVCELNALRTKTRETEIAAFNAFEDEYHNISRTDIIRALNRLSSLFWIMMFKVLTGKYADKEG